MAVRRWPIVTFALIAINVIIFLLTHTAMEEQAAQVGETKLHILILAATHPELELPTEAQSLVEKFRQSQPENWKRMQDPFRKPEDAWEIRMRLLEEREAFQQEMDSLAAKYSQQEAASIADQYAFIPASPKPVTYLTANFLHGGVLHLVFNMWFLWLAGFVLEDAWGRIVYTIFYLLAGAAALQFYAFTNPGSIIPTLGASGAVSGLMGAFLVRFPRLKIQMAWVVPVVFRVHVRPFHMSAYWLLPMWLMSEIYYAVVMGTIGGVAHWAHVGGFVFGAVIALVLHVTRIEHKLDQAVDAKVTLASDTEITNATELFGDRQWDEAIAVLQEHLAKYPDSIEGCSLLARTYRRKGDLDAYHETIIKCCQLHLKTREPKLAWEDFEEFLNAGGDPAKLLPSTWLELCLVAENQQLYERALGEYQKIIAQYASERCSLQAQLGAARVYLKRLNRPDEALKFFQAASASPVPHLDFEPAIEAGIREARATAAAQAQSAAGPA
ncbi:MAG: rhomboid family intramembrane serine protease [Terriglobales bacterium]